MTIDTRKLLDATFKFEGGFVDDPDDAGGATKYGISLRYAASKGLDVDHDGDTDKEDIKQLTIEMAEELYLADFLREPKIDQLPNSIIPVVFDAAVMSGPTRAIRYVQEVINLAGFGPIECDGKIGPTTIRKSFITEKEMGPFFVNAIVDQRIAHYQAIAKAKSSQVKYINGWERRAKTFRVPV
jgi:lysozyme family protein